VPDSPRCDPHSPWCMNILTVIGGLGATGCAQVAAGRADGRIELPPDVRMWCRRQTFHRRLQSCPGGPDPGLKPNGRLIIIAADHQPIQVPPELLAQGGYKLRIG
jgi:hypothetical protein